MYTASSLFGRAKEKSAKLIGQTEPEDGAAPIHEVAEAAGAPGVVVKGEPTTTSPDAKGAVFRPLRVA